QALAAERELLRRGKAGAVHQHLRVHGAEQEVVLVVLPHLPHVGQAEEIELFIPRLGAGIGGDGGGAQPSHRHLCLLEPKTAPAGQSAVPLPWSRRTSSGRCWITMIRVAGLRRTMAKVRPSGERS